MKNIKSFHFLFVAVVLLAMSCKKLTEKPISFVEPQNFYTTPSQIEATFAGAMNRVTSAVGEGSMSISFVHQYFANFY